jgi:hypothetical protein
MWRVKAHSGLVVLRWFEDDTLSPADSAPSRRNPGWRRAGRRRGPDFEHGVATSLVMVGDGSPLIGDGQQLGDSTRSSATQRELAAICVKRRKVMGLCLRTGPAEE